jgi:thioredoxin 1
MNPILVILIILFFVFILWGIKRYKSFVSGMNTPESEKLINLSDQNFKQQIKKGIVVVDFWAEWCQPCKIQGPIMSQLADENTDSNLRIGKLNVEKNQAMAREFGVQNIPTILIFKNGQVVDRLVGIKTKTVLERSIDKWR